MNTTTATQAQIDAAYAASVKDYFALLKPRVMSLVVFTGLVGLILAPGSIHPLIATVAIFCIALGSGAAGAINMWYEHEIDAKMERTKNRPIPAGRVIPQNAFDFAVACAFASVFMMAIIVNYVAAIILLAAILFYVFIYTIWLKQRTPQNIVIGGAAGAFPPMIGWAAVTGNVSIESVILFSIIFMWTPPHFWALALYRSGDYAKAGIPMLPVVAGEKSTKKHIIIYSWLMVPVTLLPTIMGFSGIIYGATATFLGAKFLYHAHKVNRTEDDNYKSAKQLFGYSIIYLFLLYVLLLVDAAWFVPLSHIL